MKPIRITKSLNGLNLRENTLSNNPTLNDTENINLDSVNSVESLREVEILRYVLSSTGDGIWEWDVETKQIYLSQTFYDILGYEKKEAFLNYYKLSKMVYSEDLDILRDLVNKAQVSDIEVIDCEIRVKKKTGEWIWFNTKGVPIRKNGAYGNTLKLVGTFNNISETKNTKIQLMAILESTADAILVTNKNRDIVHYNKKFKEMWRIPCELLVKGKDKSLIAYAKSLLINDDDFAMDIEDIINSGRDELDILYFIDGRIIERFHKTYIVNGKDQGSVWSFRDITERRRTEELQKSLERNRILLEKAQEYDQIKTNFFSTISHEFKTPLNIIMSCIQLLSNIHINAVECPYYPISTKYFKMMKQNSNRLLKLINNLVDITKIDSKFMEMTFGNYNIVSVIEEITMSTAEYVESNGISLIFDTDIEERIVACDLEKLERVMLNLLSNAVKFTEAGGTIKVNVINKDTSVVISVKDTGIGIPEDMIDKVFDRFKQVDSSLTRRKEGSGIGLSLVKSIVELHDGNVSLKSEVGKGSEFIIEIPARLIDDNPSFDEVCATTQPNVERISIEFSDIYINKD